MSGKISECGCACGLAGCASIRGRTHGIESTYRDGCRCSDCSAAMSGRRLKARKRHNAETQGSATRNGQQWTGPELEIVTRDDLTAREAAAMLGRTLKAVENMRHLCRTEPKYTNLLGAAAKESIYRG